MLRDRLRTMRMRLLPPSSRSFHDRTDEIDSQLGRIVSELSRLNDSISESKGISSRLDSLAEQLAVHDEHSRLRWGELYRMPGEDAEHAKRRFFAALPEAEGAMRLMQLANARLMHELDLICQKEGIEYWFCFGTLVAAKSRSGFIPWDDDIDICMMREDAERLRCALADNGRFQLSIAYDAYVFCKQVRFCSTDRNIPCFIDVCVWDWAIDANKDHDDLMRRLRLELMNEVRESVCSLPYWKERGILFETAQTRSLQSGEFDPYDQDDKRALSEIKVIQKLFDSFRDQAHELGVLCEKDQARGVSYGLENIYDAPWRRTIFPRSDFFPVERSPFESYSFLCPAKAEKVCDECYPGWPYLPKDILGHNHLPKDLLKDEAVIAALRDFMEKE